MRSKSLISTFDNFNESVENPWNVTATSGGNNGKTNGDWDDLLKICHS